MKSSGMGVAVGVGVSVLVGLGVGVFVGVRVGVFVGVALGVFVGVGVGVGVAGVMPRSVTAAIITYCVLTVVRELLMVTFA